MSDNEKNIEEKYQIDVERDSQEITFHARCPQHQSMSDSIKESDKSRLIAASILCLALMIIEGIGGILANSLAVITDAAHLFTDFGAMMVSLLAIWISTKSRNESMNFGYHRAEVIGAFLSILSIWFITGVLIYLAVQRLIHLEYDIDALLMLIISVISVIFGCILVCVLFCQFSIKSWTEILLSPRKYGINVKTAVIHVFGDLIHSLGILVASLVIYFKPDYKIADPICTFIFSIVVLCTTLVIMKEIIRVLMEGFPSHLTFSDIRNALFSIPEIIKVHNLRMWSLSMDKVALAAHVVIRVGENPSVVLKKAVTKISEQFDIYEITLQVEEDGSDNVSQLTSRFQYNQKIYIFKHFLNFFSKKF